MFLGCFGRFLVVFWEWYRTDGQTYGRMDRPSYRDAINDDLSDVPPVFKAIRIGSECYHNHDDRHGDICLKKACDPWSLRILILHGK